MPNKMKQSRYNNIQYNHNENYSNQWKDDGEIDFIDLFTILLLRRWKLVALIAIPIIITGAVYASLKPKVYTAKSLLMVSNKQANSKNQLNKKEVAINRRLALSYIELSKSKVLREKVMDKLDLDSSDKNLETNLVITPIMMTLIKNTELLRISYTDRNPQRATAIVNILTEEFVGRVRKIGYFDTIEIVETAEVPTKPSGWGKIPILINFGMLGLIFGMVTAFINEFFFRNIINPAELQNLVECEVLSSIPCFRQIKLKIKNDNNNLFFKNNQENAITEAFRILRINIHFIESKKNKILIITSSVPNEGKTFVATNYAMSEAAVGKKVLLIDLDIRKPSAHINFGLNDHSGMEEVLLGKKNANEVIINIGKNLDLIPSKHLNSNVTELIFGSVIEKTLKELINRYDLIILDTPPLTVATDAAILSKYSNGMIFVNGYDMASKKDISHAKKILNNAGANMYGMVINKVKKSGYKFGNYSYYNYNYKHYENYMDKSKKQ
ncbi:polysaccharide biosynthesis tyrosine autokinase [uncultured Ilyobacter sp.]|uniref:polysaccharide biosynthesis tyrosine autokinase n=1 Tax=uncultured Ilyobacter sp. TaxID=544433 RepID=UPI002AA7DC3E|nr:polysaccharide biosynthesis tyrosine autokinase [uncultured Ilyobacter sp.]